MSWGAKEAGPEPVIHALGRKCLGYRRASRKINGVLRRFEKRPAGSIKIRHFARATETGQRRSCTVDCRERRQDQERDPS